MRFLYALAVFAFLSTSAMAQVNAEVYEPEIIIDGSDDIDLTLNWRIGLDDLPPSYYPQDTSYTVSPFSLWIGYSVFTADNLGETSIGTPYTFEGVTAPGVVALTASGGESIGCVGTSTNDTPPPVDWVNQADFAGKIVLVRRGTCSFIHKVQNAQLAGAVGIIIYNQSARSGGVDNPGPEGNDILTGGMGGLGPGSTPPGTFTTQLTIPAMLVPNGIGQPIVDEMVGGGAVTLTMRRDDLVDTAAEAPVATTRSGLEVRGANPFRVSTDLRVYTEQAEAVQVEVFNVRGQLVSTLFNGTVAGERAVTFASADLAPGVYFVRATGETFRAQHQLTIVR